MPDNRGYLLDPDTDLTTVLQSITGAAPLIWHFIFFFRLIFFLIIGECFILCIGILSSPKFSLNCPVYRYEDAQ